MKIFLTWKYSWHEISSDTLIFPPWKYCWWQRKAVERMTLIPDKDKREQSWRWVANPRFCNQGIEHQKTFSQPSGHLYVIIRISVFVISNKATLNKQMDVTSDTWKTKELSARKHFHSRQVTVMRFFRSPMRPLETSWRMCIYVMVHLHNWLGTLSKKKNDII